MSPSPPSPSASREERSEPRRRIELYDTTLRDGVQGFGFNLSLGEKLRILVELDAMGVDYVEGGYPLSNPKDAAFFQEARSLELDATKVSAFGMTRRKGMRVDEDAGMAALLAAETPVVTIVGKTWGFHVREVLRVGNDENLRMIQETVAYLRGRGKQVIYDAEHYFDGYADDPAYAVKTLQAALDAGASLLCLCDTNGGSLPTTVGTILAETASALPGTELGIHPHNDCGLAVANALEAVRRGATQVQGTINGVGERCGNVDLIAVAANLFLKMGHPVLAGEPSIRRLRALSQFVDRAADRDSFHGQPFVGLGAFTHKGGMHVHAVQRNVSTYEHIPPESVGNSRRILISELSGISNVKERVFGAMGRRQVSQEKLREVLETVARMEKEGYLYEGADASFELLVLRVLGEEKRHFLMDHYQCSVFRVEGGPPVTTGLVTLRVDGEVCRGTAEGEDPLAALERAMRQALKGHFPVLNHVSLIDRKFRAVEGPGERGTRIRVVTEFGDGVRQWSTVAVGKNAIDAGIDSLIEGLEYRLLREEQARAEREG